MLIIILFLSLVSAIYGGCPIKCNCTDNSVNCVANNLEYVPFFENLSNNPVIIDLSGNAISLIDIDDFSFDKSDRVKEIYLNNSGLIAIEEAAFEELENLQELYLGDNLFNSLPEEFITENENIILLDLSSNYFTDMPKIRSDSLEVLTIANSGISKISDDALYGLPNLRILLMPQNNLKSINPVIFNHMSNLFFVRVAYNPWHCNCKTIKLFEYLTGRKFIDLTETVQCLREDQIFVDIYSDTGVSPAFKDQCDIVERNVVDDEELPKMEISLRNLDVEDFGDLTTVTIGNFTDQTKQEFYFSDFSYILILGICVLLSLTVGAVCGSCLTFKYMTMNIKQTESRKELLNKFDDSFVSYNFS